MSAGKFVPGGVVPPGRPMSKADIYAEGPWAWNRPPADPATRSDGSGWFTLGCVAVVSAACAFVVALGGCAPGTAGEVCNEPDAADCDSHTGGEAGP